MAGCCPESASLASLADLLPTATDNLLSGKKLSDNLMASVELATSLVES
jgi:hypothetical protein